MLQGERVEYEYNNLGNVKQEQHSHYNQFGEALKYLDVVNLENLTQVRNQPCCIEMKPGLYRTPSHRNCSYSLPGACESCVRCSGRITTITAIPGILITRNS